jgi:hypothetical protein
MIGVDGSSANLGYVFLESLGWVFLWRSELGSIKAPSGLPIRQIVCN